MIGLPSGPPFAAPAAVLAGAGDPAGDGGGSREAQPLSLFDMLGLVSPSAVVTLPEEAAGEGQVRRRTGRRRPVGLTQVTLRVERVIRRYAESNSPIPPNVEIAEMLRGPGRETVRRAVERLISAGRISVEYGERRRRMTVIASGARTDWGGCVTNTHAPYSSNPRGTPKPLAATQPPVTPRRAFPAGPAPLVETRPARECQYIFDGKKPRTCDQASVKGHSWCCDHIRTIFPNWKPRP